jgi:phosphoribosylglycinamide formyltransferase-1
VAIPASATSRARLVVLVSGAGTLLQALIDHAPAHVDIVAVGADRYGIEGLVRAEAEAIPVFVTRLEDFPDRASWNGALRDAIAEHRPDLVISAGFMKILGAPVLNELTVLNTHPALLPAFPGAHAVRDALAAGATVTGCSVHLVDEGVDTGPVLAQRQVEIRPNDDESSLHERIKQQERELLVEVVGRVCAEGLPQERVSSS